MLKFLSRIRSWWSGPDPIKLFCCFNLRYTEISTNQSSHETIFKLCDWPKFLRKAILRWNFVYRIGSWCGGSILSPPLIHLRPWKGCKINGNSLEYAFNKADVSDKIKVLLVFSLSAISDQELSIIMVHCQYNPVAFTTFIGLYQHFIGFYWLFVV